MTGEEPLKQTRVYDLCCMGHITLDKIVTPRNTVDMPGGTSFYFAEAMTRLGTEGFLLVTALGRNEMAVVEQLRRKGVEVEVLPSRHSICFENIYNEKQNERRQRVTSKADPFTVAEVAGVRAKVIHLGTLLADDFPTDTIRSLAGRARLSVDVQGLLRRVENGQVLPVDWAEKRELLPYIYTLKANEDEMKVLTGLAEPHEAALLIARWGVKEVVLTMGDKGSLIYADGSFHEIPAYPARHVVDATGCGDTYMVGYLYRRIRGASYDEAGRFAAAMCTIKLQAHGPFSGTEEDVRCLMQ